MPWTRPAGSIRATKHGPDNRTTTAACGRAAADPLRARHGRAGGDRALDGRARVQRDPRRPRRPLRGDDAAAQRHRRPAHGARDGQRHAGPADPLAPDAGRQHAVDGRHRPRRHRHAGRDRAAPAGAGRQDPPRHRPRRPGAAHLGVEGPLPAAHRRAAAGDGLLLRLGPAALHHGRGLLARRAPHLPGAVPRRAGVPRHAAGQLGLRPAHRGLRRRDRLPHRGRRLLAPALPRDRSRAGRAHPRGGGHHPPGDHARRHRRRLPPRPARGARPRRRAPGRARRPRPATRAAGPGGAARRAPPTPPDPPGRPGPAGGDGRGRPPDPAAPARPRDPADHRRVGQARGGLRLREDHARPRPQRLRGVAAPPGPHRPDQHPGAGRHPERRGRPLRRPRPLRGAHARGGRPPERRPAGPDRAAPGRDRPLRPLRHRHRAVPVAAVVPAHGRRARRRHRGARHRQRGHRPRAGAGGDRRGGRRLAVADRAQARLLPGRPLRAHLPGLAGREARLEHQPAALVGTPDPDLDRALHGRPAAAGARPGRARQGPRGRGGAAPRGHRRDRPRGRLPHGGRGGRGARVRRGGDRPLPARRGGGARAGGGAGRARLRAGPRRAGHLVLQRAVAAQHPGLARSRRRPGRPRPAPARRRRRRRGLPELLLPRLLPGDRPRHHHPVGGAHGDRRHVQPGRPAVRALLRARQHPGRQGRDDEQVGRQRHRSRSTSSSATAPTRCAT